MTKLMKLYSVANDDDQESFRIIKKLSNVVLGSESFERMIGLRMKKHHQQQFVCIFKVLNSKGSSVNLECFGSSREYAQKMLRTPLVLVLPTSNYLYRDDQNSNYVVMNCVLRERLSNIRTRVSDAIILQIIYQYMQMIEKMDEYFEKPNHQRKCNRPEVSVERFNSQSGKINLIFGSTDLSSEKYDSDNLVEISNNICNGRNEFEKEMLFEIVEFITQEHTQKELDTRVLLSRLEQALKGNEFSSIYLDAFKCILNGGPKSLANLYKSTLFSENSPNLYTFSSFYDGLSETIKTSKRVFIELFRVDSNVVNSIHESLTGDRELIKILVERSSLNMRYVDVQYDREFIRELIEINPLILVESCFEEMAKDEELWLYAISKNPIALTGYYREDYDESESFKQKMKQTTIENGYLILRCDLEDLFKNDRDSIVKLVSKFGFAYSRIPTEFKNDREIAKISISNCGLKFSEIPNDFKDKEMALIAIKENGSVYRMLPSELKNDPEIIEAAGSYAKPRDDDY